MCTTILTKLGVEPKRVLVTRNFDFVIESYCMYSSIGHELKSMMTCMEKSEL